MHPETLKEAKAKFTKIKNRKHSSSKTTTVVCVPHVYLSELAALNKGTKIALGAQDCFWEKVGSKTGEVSPDMLKSIGVKYVILGHSSRRALGESDEKIAKKVAYALKVGLKVVLCLGETQRKRDGSHLKDIENQLKGSLEGVSRAASKNLIVAYEPVWAISQGKKNTKSMTPHDVHQSIMFVRTLLMKKFGKKVGSEVPVLYGGSSNSGNARALVYEGETDGLLPGTASRDPENFTGMIEEVAKGAEKK